MSGGFLPVSKEDLARDGIAQPDFVYVIGDAYVDHPSFGPAVISRVLQSRGYTVGIIPQPDWKDPESVTILGRPRLGFLVSAGNMDSMVNHYTVSKKRRSRDSYTPGGVMGRRPDRAVIVYCNLIRSVYKDVPIIAGGIEASLRRLAHYDYWQDGMRRSVLMDCGADLISYGMGELSIVEIADALASGLPVSQITWIAGTCFKTKDRELIGPEAVMLPDYDELLHDKRRYAESFRIQSANTDAIKAKRLAEPYGTVYVVQNPPARPLTMQEMDDVYALPYTRRAHPMYDAAGGVPALAEVKFSLTSCRGCFGACSFCALTFHQGRTIQARSHDSIEAEAKLLIQDPEFKGYIHDVGGPTANFRAPSCRAQLRRGVCPDRQCLGQDPCRNLEVDHTDYIRLLRRLRALPGVKKVFVRSGIRFDYVMLDRSDAFLTELCRYHVSGQLKVAPEHVSDRVLACLGKPRHSVYVSFAEKYRKINERYGLRQYLVPYLMSSHPGCTMREAVELAEYVRDMGVMPEQVQDFYPTPSTISTCMYYTGLDPRTMEPVYVPKDPHEKAMQRALIQYRDPKNRALVEEALRRAHRTDLIGFGPKCLLRPEREEKHGTGREGRRPEGRKPEGRGRNGARGEKAQQKTGGRGQRPARHGGRPAAKERGRGGRFGEQKR